MKRQGIFPAPPAEELSEMLMKHDTRWVQEYYGIAFCTLDRWIKLLGIPRRKRHCYHRASRRCWLNMMDRCYNPNNPCYSRYGGRGISVSDEWKDYETFLKDMGIPPVKMTLERINNSGGYSKDNCKWATRAEQVVNRDVTELIEFRGERRTMSDWERHLKIYEGCLKRHKAKGGDVTEKLTTIMEQREK